VNALHLVGALFFLSCAWSSKTPIDIDTAVFPSRDGKYIASFEQNEDGWLYLEIKDSKTGHLDGSVKAELTPVFSVQWTGDSKTIVLVGHVAHGSAAILFHFQAKNWSSYIFYPPDFQGDPHFDRIVYDVVQAHAGEHDVSLTYKLGLEVFSDMDRGLPEKRFLVTDVIDPSTNQILKSKRTLAK
jgi:hypothetical protein